MQRARRSLLFETGLPFRPANRRAAQASGLVITQDRMREHPQTLASWRRKHKQVKNLLTAHHHYGDV
jgi:hypothetical protein